MAFGRHIDDLVARRAKARCIRALTRVDDPKVTVDQAAEKHKVSRATAYRLVEDLESWEIKATPQDEAQEILAQLRGFALNNNVWLLVSGRLLMAYMQGHDGIGPELFGGAQDASQDLSTDPLCE